MAKQKYEKDTTGLLIGQVATLGTSGKEAEQLASTFVEPANAAQNELDDLNAKSFNAGSYDALASLLDSTNLAKTNYTGKDLQNIDLVGGIGKVFGTGISGAMEGVKAFGPWGAFKGLADAALTSVGLGLGIAGSNRAAQQLNYDANAANNNLIAKAKAGAINVGKQMSNAEQLNIAAEGGPLWVNDFFTNGVRKIENGGSHEQNPLQGVPMGIAADGLENLVEQGELIYKDYVYSNRLMVPEASKAILGLSKKKDYTFAEAAEQIQKESEERPNDPISERTLDEMMGRLQEAQETVKAKKESRRLRAAFNKLSPLEKMSFAYAAQSTQSEVPMFAKGGLLGHKYDGLTFTTPYGQTLTYATRPDVYQGLSEDDWNRLMFETYGELNHDDNIIGETQGVDRTPVAGSQGEASGLKDGTGITIDKDGNEGPVSDRNVYDDKGNIIGEVDNSDSPSSSDDTTESNANFAQALRAASVFGALKGAFGSLFDRPNYRNIKRAERAMSAVPRVAPGYVGQKMPYSPLDINYLATQGANQSLAARRALVEAGQGPQAIVANNFATQTGMGQNFLQMLQQNNARRLQALDFNRGTDTTNIANNLNADLANQRRDIMGANFLLETADRRNQELATLQNQRSVQWTNAYNQLHNLGTDMLNRQMVAANIDSGTYGVMNEIMKGLANGTLKLTSTSAEGGKLNTKKGGKHA